MLPIMRRLQVGIELPVPSRPWLILGVCSLSLLVAILMNEVISEREGESRI